MQTKPIFIGLAAGILVLVVAAASFTAGLYTGKSGQAAQDQSQIGLGGPGQGADGNRPQQGQGQNGQRSHNGQGGPQSGGQNGPQSGQPPQGGFGPPGALSWPPDSIGHIIAISDTQFTYENRDGTIFTVTFDATTKFTDAEGVEIAATDLQIGDVIAVYGTDLATTIMQMPPKPDAPVTTPTVQPIP